MFNFLKNKPSDTKTIRNALLHFFKEELQKAEGGEGKNIQGITLYITCDESEKHLYEAAIYVDDENRFKTDELQKMADDYAIALPVEWTFDYQFIKEAPANTITANDVDAALFISTKTKHSVYKISGATITVISGEAEHSTYKISAGNNAITIGREKETQTTKGDYQRNAIAFVGDNEINKTISRQHAHISWNARQGAFYLFADEGGIPPHNKLKVRTGDGTILKLQTTEFGHRLHDNDQVILGDSAVLEFRIL